MVNQNWKSVFASLIIYLGLYVTPGLASADTATPSAVGDTDNFITVWDLSKQGNYTAELRFGTSNSGGSISYNWQELPTGASGSGTFEAGTNVLRKIQNLPANARIRLEIEPTHLERFYMRSGSFEEGLVDVEQWGTASWTQMRDAFFGCENLIITATDTPDLSRVTSLVEMFRDCKILNGPSNINEWNTSNVIDMSRMFEGAFTFNQDISNWDVGNVINMFTMFYEAHAFDQDISSWNTSNVTNMFFMFREATSFNQDISSWNTANVSSMAYMFLGAASFNQNLGSWTLNSGVNLSNMLDDSGLDCANYSATLIGWAENSPGVVDITLGANGLSYGTNAAAARTILTTDRGWSILGDTAGTEACELAPSLADTDYFVTIWDLSKEGISSDQIFFSTSNPTGPIAYSWQVLPDGETGTGTFEAGSDAPRTIQDLPANAKIRLEIAPTHLERFYFGSANGLVDVEQWGTASWTSMENAFNNSQNLDITATDMPDLSQVSSLSRMFSSCKILNGPATIKDWNTGNVTNMSSMFQGAEAFNQDISGWNTSNVTSMSSMFDGAVAFNQPIGSWNTANVTDMLGMFQGATAFSQDLSNWNTGNVIDMPNMFRRASAFNSDISNWNTGNVTSMSNMFRDATAFNQDISGWNTEKVESMSSLFRNAAAFNQDISSWNTANVTSMSNMFRDATAFNQDISGWNTEKVESMWRMFSGATAFNQDISSWNTANVSDMSSMFEGASAFNQNLGSWSLNSEVDLSNMLDDSGLDCANYSATLIGWAENNTDVVDKTLGANGLSYGTNAAAARTTLTTTRLWSILGDTAGTEACELAPSLADTDYFVTIWDLSKEGGSDGQIAFQTNNSSGSVNYRWEQLPSGETGSGSFDTGSGINGVRRSISDLPTEGKIRLEIEPTNLERFFFLTTRNTNSRLVQVTQWGTVSWSSMKNAFFGCDNLMITASDTPDLSGVTDMTRMFKNAKLLNGPSNINTWNTDNVSNMSSLFEGAEAFNQDIGNWNTLNVADMSYMFSGATAFNQDIGQWNTEKVYTMYEMFRGAAVFNQDISSWNVGNVEDMYRMFSGATSFNQGIGSWNTEKVTDMSSLFNGATSFNQDISSWSTANVTNMSRMFAGASAFNQNLGSWTLNSGVNLSNMLDDSGLDCTNYSATLIGWAENNSEVVDKTMGANGLSYGTNAAAARTTLTTDRLWSILGDTAGSSVCLDAVVPEGPTDLSVIEGDGQLEISFTAGDDGGSAITNYEYSLDGGKNWVAFDPAATVSPVTISGLDNGTEYSITLRAMNAIGAGASSNEVKGTPKRIISAKGIKIAPVTSMSYTGAAIEPAPSIKDGDKVLISGTDYTLEYTDNVNAGIASLTVTGKGAYTGTVSVIFTIDKARVTITADNKQRAFGEDNPELTFTYKGLVNGDTEIDTEPSITTTATATSEVGEYPITLTGGADDNYEIELKNGTLTVGKAKVTITADDKSKTYGEENPELTFTYSGLINGGTKIETEPSITTTATATSAAGDYPITLTGGADDNYEIELVNGTLAVGKAKVTITADNKQRAFGEDNPGLTFTYSGLTNGDTKIETEPSIATTATQVSAAGTYPITLEGGSDENYEIELKNGTLTVGKAKVTITAENKQRAFGEANPELTFTYSGLVGDDTKIEIEPTISTTATQVSAAGTYPITLEGGSDDNYEIELKNGTLTVGKAKVTITADDRARTYGFGTPALTFRYEGLVNGDTRIEVEPAISTPATDSSPAGIYPIELSGGSDPNYTIRLVNGELIIGRKALTITADDKQKDYGEENPTLTFAYDGLVNGDTQINTEPSIATTATASSNVGSYPITLTGGADQNYTITLVDGTLTVGKKALTITAEDKQKIYGEANPELTFTYDGLTNGDTKVATEPSIATTATEGSNVGSYPITLTGAEDQNYAITLVDGTLTVGRKALTIRAEDKQKVYGEENPTLTFAYDGLVNGDTKVATEPSIATTATEGSNVGSYPITLTGGADQNYTITLVDGTLTIGKKDLTIRAEDKQKVYGEANPTLTFAYDGLVNGDTKVATEPSIATAATASSNVGSYPITLTGAEDQNYAITLVDGTLSITAKMLTVRADEQEKIFGREDPELSFRVDGLTAGDGNSVFSGELVREPGEEVGVYAILQGTLEAGPNYQISFIGASLEIVPARLSAVLNPELLRTPWSVLPTLPETVRVLTADGQEFGIRVSWDVSTLDVFRRGLYFVNGTLALPTGILNESDVKAVQQVEVLSKPAPFDVTLSNNVFAGEERNFFITVGAFTVIDPVDDIHEVSLFGPGYDNGFFEIRDNILFWSSADRAEGRTSFTIIVQVTDRDGNTLEKFFEISRTRQDINEIEVYNAFTPDGDGINDTWGVPGIRFFSGARIQVFDRSGERVFYTEDPDAGWDGTYKGRELPTGAYTWVLEVKETGEKRMGILNLLRK